jgi:hypothetical protein
VIMLLLRCCCLQATVHVPRGAEGRTVLEGGIAMEGGRREAGSMVFEVGSGNYEFTSWLQ